MLFVKVGAILACQLKRSIIFVQEVKKFVEMRGI